MSVRSCCSERGLRRRRAAGGGRAARGFTLLEVEIALVVLALAFLLLSRLGVAHGVLLGKTEEWLEGDPVLFVVPREDEFERLLFHAPDLLDAPPAPGGGPPPGAGPPPAHAVTILGVTRQLVPRRITVLVEWEE